jgi:hypothetical protein
MEEIKRQPVGPPILDSSTVREKRHAERGQLVTRKTSMNKHERR